MPRKKTLPAQENPAGEKIKIKTSNLYPYKKIVIVYFLFVILLIISIFYLLFSKASVLISFNTEPITSTFIINLDLKTDLSRDALKSDMAETIVEKEETFFPDLSKPIEAKAGGEVTIVNAYTKNQTLIATTRLLSPEGLLFRITKNVVAPAKGEVKVEVLADQLGKEYEIAPAKFTIPGLRTDLQDKIYGKSDKAMSSNAKKVGIITQEGIEKAKISFYQKIENDTISQLKIKPQIIKTELISEAIDAKPGDEKESFKIKSKVKVITISFNDKELENFLTYNFSKLMPQEKQLASINRENLSYSLVDYNVKEKTGKIKVSAEGNFVPDLKVLNIPKNKLVGLTEPEVIEYFSNFQTIKNVEVKLKPFWLTTMPLLSDKIEIDSSRN